MMASTVSENGDATEEVPQSSDISGPKINGEVNGSYEEPMDVDESPVKTVKKVNSSDINCISNTDSNSNSASEFREHNNSISEDSVAELDAAVESEVPENVEATSNGVSEEHKEELSSDETQTEDKGQEENLENEQKEGDVEDGKDNVVDDDDDDDDVVLMEDEEPKDPFAEDSEPVDEPIQTKPVEITESGNAEDDDPPSELEQGDEGDPLSKDDEHDSEIKLIEEDKSNQEESQANNDDVENKDEKEDTNIEKGASENPGECKEDESLTEVVDNDKSGDEKMEVDGEKSEDSPDKSKSEESSDKTPDKAKKKKIQQQPINITPRRSSRNVNKPKVYIDEPDIKPTNSTPTKKDSDDPDIEEIVPQDPLAIDSPISDKKNKKTVVVNDPKRLVEIASGSKQSRQGKKEPTLVIIDTNSILSGRGPVPVSSSPPLSQSPTVTGSPHTQGFSVLPMALPAQGMYPQPMRHPQMKPVVMPQTGLTVTPSPQSAPKPPVILPSLTDDMYVVEAPSFIVPYVYEKPPIKPLKNFVDQVEQAIKEIKAQLEKEKEAEKKAEEDEEKSKKKEEDKEDRAEKSEAESSKEAEESKDDVMEVDDSSEKTPKDSDASTKDKEETKDEDKAIETKSSDSKTDKPSEKPSEEGKTDDGEKTKKPSNSYFDNPLGKFFIQIGVNLVQEHVQTDLLRSQKRKKEREGAKCTPEVQQAMNSLIRSLEFSKETNEPFKLELKKCEFCSFKTESALVMAHHLETPHMRNYVYRCNFCPLEVRSPHDILYHMEAEHNVRGRLERAPAFHQCPSCPFEDNQKGKLSRHLLSCAKKYRPERNQEPPLDFEPPAKIPRVSRNRPSMSPGTAVYQAAMSGLKQGVSPSTPQHSLLPKLVPAPSPPGMVRGRGRPQMLNRYLGDMRSPASLAAAQHKAMAAQMRPGMLYRPSGSNAQPQVLLPTSYQLAGTQLYQVSNHNRGLAPLTLPAQTAAASAAANKSAVGSSTAKLLQQPSISITPLPRQQPPPQPAPTPIAPPNKPGRPAGASKATFVICEICDGYIKDLEQLRNHMQWIHKVKIHPKMIYNRPPLNCQKCQFRFFTDQGLERHLLGSHGLVTSSMQEAANKGKDGGRCPVCGRVYQWKLLNHVARDHNMSLKPAHLSYKCTVCTATFGMYKQFENHVYSAHSVVAKRVMDKKPSSAQPSTSSQGDMLKPLKINDEITIIPQPARSKTKPTGSNRNPQKKV